MGLNIVMLRTRTKEFPVLPYFFSPYPNRLWATPALNYIYSASMKRNNDKPDIFIMTNVSKSDPEETMFENHDSFYSISFTIELVDHELQIFLIVFSILTKQKM